MATIHRRTGFPSFTVAALALAIAGLAAVNHSALAEEAKIKPPSGEAIVSPDAKLELLYTRTAPISGGLTEGPAAAPDGSIYFSEIPFGSDKGMIMRFDPKSMKTTVFAEDSFKSNGLLFDAQGFLLACEGSDGGGRRISKWNVKTKERVTLADKYNGKRFNACNDLCQDRLGRVYFSDPRYLGDEPRELEHRAVYRLDTTGENAGKVVEVTHDVSKPNGVALSPDQKTLYVADHDNGTDRIDPNVKVEKKGPMKLYAFPLGEDGLVKGERKTLIDFGDEEGSDGMTVDTLGHIYLTSRSPKRPGVLVIDPTGKEVAFIPTGPENQPSDDPAHPHVGMPSNVEFGVGDEANMLYVTIDKTLQRIPLKVKGRK